MVAAEQDGEDSKGRAKLKLSAPEDVVDRAIRMIDYAWDLLMAKGWILKGPTYEESIYTYKIKETEDL